MKKPDLFSPAFLEKIMQQHAPEKNIQVLQVSPLPVDSSASILAVLTAGQSEKLIGHFGLSVSFKVDDVLQNRRLVMKVKPHGQEITAMLQSLSQAVGGNLAQVYPTYRELTGFTHTHLRELEIYHKLPSTLMPEIFGIYTDEDTETYVILMEYLEEVELLNTVMAPEKWTDLHIQTALTQLAEWHAQHLEKSLPLNPTAWTDAPSKAYMLQLTPLWEALLQNAATNFPDLYTNSRTAQLQQVINNIPDYWQELEAMPKTLVHNDMNPRNTCFKQLGNELNFCVYDWELATYHVPQYDVVELLCFVLDEDRYDLRQEYLEFYRENLHYLTGLFADKEHFKRGFALAAYDFGLHRLGMYMMAHQVGPYPFLPRVVNSYFNTLEQLESNQTVKGLWNKAYVADS